ncbi:ADP-heptose--LPS heptosyltransferase 2 [Anaerohalosphaera lusitana]|uniref:ADP-heptose--LPS heptosyltransferase 2 n=1 Tax=Anaerohalosphaera lusitana TaxID=1936003 RepID=A0A1U9NMC3_9BACT|nr:glycosyltransferase family 9 protein [Anaerohalosphaera lusitana]AQT69059.1 ADP-heptose--LPS heptosyltransferase 2 [Anaerohalosphaera lusitana]
MVIEENVRTKNQGMTGAIINPGAIGDCILTLPLARFLKERLSLARLDMIANSDYVSFYPKRTCVDVVRSINSIAMHRLFVGPDEFELDQHDQLIRDFSHYDYIVSLLGEPGGSFESNLIFTVYCSRSAEVTTIRMHPAEGQNRHVAVSYIDQYCEANGLQCEGLSAGLNTELITPTADDKQAGRFILQSLGVNPDKPVIGIHPGSGGKYKCWHIDNYLALAEKVRKNGSVPVFIIGPAEKEHLNKAALNRINDEHTVAENYKLLEIMQILSTVQAFVGNDSGIAHLAAGSGLPAITVFGPTDPALYKPAGPHSHAIAVEPVDFDEPNPAAVEDVEHSLNELLAKTGPC